MTEPDQRAIVLLALLLAAGWCWYYAHTTALAVLAVVVLMVLMVLMQWINERSKR